ncbi:hypothetical protein Q8A73_002792 [Channa argus]|nr:hypothetical protein Q8A73_002792 [Channa argus]
MSDYGVSQGSMLGNLRDDLPGLGSVAVLRHTWSVCRHSSPTSQLCGLSSGAANVSFCVLFEPVRSPFCRPDEPLAGSKQSNLLLSGYKVSAWIKGIVSPPAPPPPSLWPLLPASSLTWQIQRLLCLPSSGDIQATGLGLLVPAAIFGPSLSKPLFQIKSQHNAAFLSWYSLLGVR